MWRRFLYRRAARPAYRTRRGPFLRGSYTATVLIVSAAIVLVLYLLGHVSLPSVDL